MPRALVTLVVVALLAGLAVLAASYLVPVVVPLAPAVDPAGAVDVSRPSDASAAAAVGAPVTPARVVGVESCATPGARDTVALGDGPASRVVPVESCGNRVGSVIEVEVPSDGPARVRGTGASTARPDVDETAVNGPATRVAVVLVVVAALGTAGLVVALAREGRRRGRTAGRRPARVTPRR